MSEYKVHLRSGNVIEMEHENLPKHIGDAERRIKSESGNMLILSNITVNGTLLIMNEIAAIELVKDGNVFVNPESTKKIHDHLAAKDGS